MMNWAAGAEGGEFSYFGVIAVCPFEIGGVESEEI